MLVRVLVVVLRVFGLDNVRKREAYNHVIVTRIRDNLCHLNTSLGEVV